MSMEEAVLFMDQACVYEDVRERLPIWNILSIDFDSLGQVVAMNGWWG